MYWYVRQVTSNIQHLTFDITKTNPRDVQIRSKKYWTTAINLRAGNRSIYNSISESDAIFLLPVTRMGSSPNVHSLSQWRILLFVRTTSSVILTISLQKHASPGTSVLIDYKRRHISTSGWAQNTAKRAQSQWKNVIRPLYLSYCPCTVSFLLYSVESPCRSNHSIYIWRRISTSDNAQFVAERAQLNGEFIS